MKRSIIVVLIISLLFVVGMATQQVRAEDGISSCRLYAMGGESLMSYAESGKVQWTWKCFLQKDYNIVIEHMSMTNCETEGEVIAILNKWDPDVDPVIVLPDEYKNGFISIYPDINPELKVVLSLAEIKDETTLYFVKNDRMFVVANCLQADCTFWRKLKK